MPPPGITISLTGGRFNMSLINKIMFRGWNKPDGFPREQIGRELDAPEENRHIAGKAKFKCKRNKGDHNLILIPPTGDTSIPGLTNPQYTANLFRPKPESSYMARGADVYQCQACGHIDVQWKK